MSETLAAVVTRRVHDAALGSVPMCAFIPKCQPLPFLACFISGSRALPRSWSRAAHR